MTRRHDHWRPWLIGVAALAGASYASFPLALLVNPEHAFAGLVSFLGQADQPFGWLFDELDIVSTGASLFVLLVVVTRYKVVGRLYKWALGLALASSLGTLLAAVVPLPDAFEDVTVSGLLHATGGVDRLQIICHGLGSFVNSTAFVIAAILWAMAHRHGAGSLWRITLASIITLLSTVGYAVGEIYPASSPPIQRLFIVAYAIWFVAFTYDVTVHPRRPRFVKK